MYVVRLTDTVTRRLTSVTDLGHAAPCSRPSAICCQQDAIAKARASGKSALELDPNLADAHLAQGRILEVLDFNFAAAEAEARRALELAPQNPSATNGLANLISNLGRLDEAVVLAQRAIALDPLRTGFATKPSDHTHHARSLRRGRGGGAQSRRAPAAGRHKLHVAGGDTDPPRQLQRRGGIGETGNRSDFPHYGLALAQFANGARAEADAALKKLIDEDAEDAGFQIAQVYALRKEPEKMFEWLEHGWTTHDSGVAELLDSPFLRAYKDDPRFIAFAQKIGVMPKADDKP